MELLLVKDSNISSYRLKNRLFKENILKNECSKCGLGNIWLGEPISLQLEHKNGNHSDNRLENLCILCPNCHSQTPTFCRSKSSLNMIDCDLVAKEFLKFINNK